jgi:broad specificity phosphatase PhoE
MTEATWVYLVRHGATDWNGEYRIQGHTDIPLNDLGRRQAMALRKRLADLSPTTIYCSDLCRCTETARLALPNRFNPPGGASGSDGIGEDLRLCEALRERCFGEWEGLNREEILDRYPGLYERWTSREPGFLSPGAESHEALRARMAAFLETAAEECRGGSALLFSHGGTILTAIGYALGAPVEPRLPISVENASVTALRRTAAGWQVGFVNDTSHLRPRPPRPFA